MIDADEVDGMDEQLLAALLRVEPPAGFADRVLARLDEEPIKVLRWPVRVRRTVMRWGIGSAAAAVLLGSLAGMRVEHRHREAEEANREFALAGQVTQRVLQQTREQLGRAGVRLEE